VTKLGGHARVSRESVKWKVKKASQEHGILVQHNASALRGETLQVGDMLEIVPQHACLAAAAHPWFYIVDSDLPGGAEKIVDVWVPWKGW
jgi:D-serine deaminase-like pyridoxal phosphate-dependent protein